MTCNPTQQKNYQLRSSEQGSALVYILIAIALLAALTMTFMQPSSQQTTSQGSFRAGTAIQTQADQIRSAIQECILRYPNGDQSLDIDTSDPGARKEYPLKPNSTYLTNPADNRNARYIMCPGDAGSGGANDHTPLFAGASGKFLASPPDLFEEWQYYNGQDGVFFWIRTTKSDAFLKSALEKLDDKYSECEVDVVTAGGSPVDMDSDSSTQASCPANNTCFRVWMLQNDSAVFQSGSDEESAGC